MRSPEIPARIQRIRYSIVVALFGLAGVTAVAGISAIEPDSPPASPAIGEALDSRVGKPIFKEKMERRITGEIIPHPTRLRRTLSTTGELVSPEQLERELNEDGLTRDDLKARRVQGPDYTGDRVPDPWVKTFTDENGQEETRAYGSEDFAEVIYEE